MKITQVSTVYFSPTGSTKRVMQLITDGQKGKKTELDLTDARRVGPDYCFLENEAVFVGAPVYGGRIPDEAQKRFRKLCGNNTPAVIVVTYGNRDFEDALLELKQVMTEQGFRVLAAAAIVTEHNIFPAIGSGRPDEVDCRAIASFSGQVEGLLESLKSTYRIGNLDVPGNRPYREYNGILLKQSVKKLCNQCGLCIRKCPVQAISRTDAAVLDPERCISCMRCIAVCPLKARRINPVIQKLAERGMKKKCKVRRNAEFFLI